MTLLKKLWMGIFILVVLCPIGLISPHLFKANTAWGEWGMEDIRKLVGYVPQGLERLSRSWTAPFAEYQVNGWENGGFSGQGFAYVVSAILGITITVVCVLILGRFLTRAGDKRDVDEKKSFH